MVWHHRRDLYANSMKRPQYDDDDDGDDNGDDGEYADAWTSPSVRQARLTDY